MERTDFEVQIIHKDKFGLTLAVAILLKSSNQAESNPFLTNIGFTNSAEPSTLKTNETYSIESTKIDLNQVILKEKSYFDSFF